MSLQPDDGPVRCEKLAPIGAGGMGERCREPETKLKSGAAVPGLAANLLPGTFARDPDIGALLQAAFACALVAVVAGLPAEARVKKIQITAKESPTFGGYSWPGVGQYEKIAGKAFGELDPKDPKNAVIVDLQLAPRNANGKVEYSFDFYILKPIDLAKGNHKMLYEPPNRGRKTITALNRGVGGNDPGSVKVALFLANSFLMPQGYSISFSGWDFSAGTSTGDFDTTITLPVARNPDGSSLTGPSYEYIVDA